MKYIAFTISIFLFAVRAAACWFPVSEDCNSIMIYRLYPEVDMFTRSYYPYYCQPRSSTYKKENIDLWIRQTSHAIDPFDVDELVYSTTDRNFDKVMEHNSMGRWLEAHSRYDIVAYLDNLKKFESIHARMSDPWYYPDPSDYYIKSLEDIIENEDMYFFGNDATMRGRWVLLKLRCLHATHRYEEAYSLWHTEKDSIARNVVYDMAEREAAAAMHRTGHDEEAIPVYARCGDIESLRICGVEMKDVMETVYEHCPDSPYFPEMLQRWLVMVDNHYLTEKDYRYTEEDRENAIRILEFSKRVIRERRASNLGIWYYSSAALCDALGNWREALHYISEGMRCKHNTEFLNGSFRVLRMFVEAEHLPFTKSYEARLLDDLRWLCGKSDADMTEAVRHRQLGLKSYTMNNNTYYWNDALRRIAIGELSSRLVKSGHITEAIALSNMADNRMFETIGSSKKYGTYLGHRYNAHDYANSLFLLVDSLPASQIEKYVSTLSGHSSPLIRFANANSLTDRDFWFDILASHFMREEKYDKAIRYLSRISPNYQSLLNTDCEGYMTRDPFDFNIHHNDRHRHHIPHSSHYKLDFARKMHRLQGRMRSRDANERAVSTIEYAIGLRNQAFWCWSLTRYEDTISYYCEDPEFIKEYGEYFHNMSYIRSNAAHSEALITKALSTFTDPELAAHYLHLLARNRDVMNRYPDTETAQFLRSHCDTWKDYKPQNTKTL